MVSCWRREDRFRPEAAILHLIRRMTCPKREEQSRGSPSLKLRSRIEMLVRVDPFGGERGCCD